MLVLTSVNYFYGKKTNAIQKLLNVNFTDPMSDHGGNVKQSIGHGESANVQKESR
jgi:hypothetical protein